MKFSLCLSGGGARGSFELGVLQYMQEHNIDFDVVSGSSIGAVIAASYSSGVEPRKILEIFKTKEMKESIVFNYFKMGLLTINKEAKIFDELFPIKNLEDIPKKVFICAFDVKSKELVYIDKGSVKNACFATTALFPYFSPVHLDDKLYIDGGLVDNLPITPLLDYKNKILSIDLFPLRKDREGKYIKFTKTINPLRIIRNRIFKRLIENHFISIKNSDYYITNDKLRGIKILSFENLDYGFNLGYQTASEYFVKMKLK